MGRGGVKNQKPEVRYEYKQANKYKWIKKTVSDVTNIYIWIAKTVAKKKRKKTTAFAWNHTLSHHPVTGSSYTLEFRLLLDKGLLNNTLMHTFYIPKTSILPIHPTQPLSDKPGLRNSGLHYPILIQQSKRRTVVPDTADCQRKFLNLTQQLR